MPNNRELSQDLQFMGFSCCSVLQAAISAIPTNWKKRLIVLAWKRKRHLLNSNNYSVLHWSMWREVCCWCEFDLTPQSFRDLRNNYLILALNVIVKSKLQFPQGILAAYIDLKQALHSVNRDASVTFDESVGFLQGLPIRWQAFTLKETGSALKSG